MKRERREGRGWRGRGVKRERREREGVKEENYTIKDTIQRPLWSFVRR